MEPFKPSVFVSAIKARLSRSWVSPLSLSYNGESCTLDLNETTTFQAGVELVYDWANTEIHLFLPNQNLCEFLDTELKGLLLETLSEEIRLLILQALQNVIKDLFASCKETLIPKSVTFFNETKPLFACFSLCNQEKILCQIGLTDDEGTETFFRKIAQKNTDSPAFETSDIAFPFRIEQGRLILSFDEYKSLRCGDILLNRTPYLRFHYSNVNFYAEQKGNIITVKGKFMEEKDDLPAGIIPDEIDPNDEQIDESEDVSNSSPDEESSSDKDKNVSVEQLPIVITFDTGKQILTLDQLKQLHEGYTFELDKKTDDLVSILANGQCIGQGEWIQIDDHLGVRITHLK